ncbi:MAG: VacJ family lipoprotein [Gammaproteobacteria bacterium]|nr:VacJ family lipoprotein [Gammaproteobacteria bacterium]
MSTGLVPRTQRPVAGRAAAAVIVLLLGVGLGGCATSGSPKAGNEQPRAKNTDPFEPMNRGIYRFNDALDRHALRPVATAYRNHVPQVVQTGIGNFFDNLGYPTTIVNQFLQGKFREGTQDTGRFLLNTTLGWGGIFDVASGGTNLPKHDEDSGQTLGKWGVPPGPYLVLPFLGPANLRDAPARVADDFTRPFRWYDSGAERWFSLAISLVDTRAQFLPFDATLERTYDPYAFVRNAYRQRRQYAVYDGNPPQNPADDEAAWAEEALQDDAAADDPPPAEAPPPPQQ